MTKLMSNIRKSVRRTLTYEAWLYYRKRQQLAAFNRLLDSSMFNDGNGAYSLPRTKAKLFAKQPYRRPFIGRDGKPKIVAFGASDWEKYGLWPTLERMSHFNLFNYGEIKPCPEQRQGLELRKRLAHKFLKYIDLLDQIEPVNACFFYADSSFIAPEMLTALAQLGIWTIIMGLDDKHRYYERYKNEILIGQKTIYRLCDLAWTTWKLGADIITEDGGTPWYAAPGGDPNFYHPIKCEKDLEVVFIGQSYGNRNKMVQYLRKRGFDVNTYGEGWPSGFLDFDDVLKIYSRSKVVFGVGDVQSMFGVQHLKGRDFEVPMCGALYLTSYNPELADYYEIGKEILCYSSPENCSEILHWILQRPGEQEKIRRAALNRATKNHTWEKRFHDMFALFPNVYG